jgi:hypothetical protein
MNPDGSDSPMESPIALQDGRFIHRREHVNAAQHSNSGAVVTSPDFFRQVPSKTDHSDVTLIDSRRPFIRKNHVYPYEKVSFGAFRVMLCDTVAHWRGGPRLEDIILWDCWTDAFRKDFMAKWKNQVADAVHHKHRRDGGYIDQYGDYDEQHVSSMSAAHII